MDTSFSNNFWRNLSAISSPENLGNFVTHHLDTFDAALSRLATVLLNPVEDQHFTAFFAQLLTTLYAHNQYENNLSCYQTLFTLLRAHQKILSLKLPLHYLCDLENIIVAHPPLQGPSLLYEEKADPVQKYSFWRTRLRFFLPYWDAIVTHKPENQTISVSLFMCWGRESLTLQQSIVRLAPKMFSDALKYWALLESKDSPQLSQQKELLYLFLIPLITSITKKEITPHSRDLWQLLQDNIISLSKLISSEQSLNLLLALQSQKILYPMTTTEAHIFLKLQGEKISTIDKLADKVEKIAQLSFPFPQPAKVFLENFSRQRSPKEVRAIIRPHAVINKNWRQKFKKINDYWKLRDTDFHRLFGTHWYSIFSRTRNNQPLGQNVTYQSRIESLSKHIAISRTIVILNQDWAFFEKILIFTLLHRKSIQESSKNSSTFGSFLHKDTESMLLKKITNFLAIQITLVTKSSSISNLTHNEGPQIKETIDSMPTHLPPYIVEFINLAADYAEFLACALNDTDKQIFSFWFNYYKIPESVLTRFNNARFPLSLPVMGPPASRPINPEENLTENLSPSSGTKRPMPQSEEPEVTKQLKQDAPSQELEIAQFLITRASSFNDLEEKNNIKETEQKNTSPTPSSLPLIQQNNPLSLPHQLVKSVLLNQKKVWEASSCSSLMGRPCANVVSLHKSEVRDILTQIVRDISETPSSERMMICFITPLGSLASQQLKLWHQHFTHICEKEPLLFFENNYIDEFEKIVAREVSLKIKSPVVIFLSPQQLIHYINSEKSFFIRRSSSLICSDIISFLDIQKALSSRCYDLCLRHFFVFNQSRLLEHIGYEIIKENSQYPAQVLSLADQQISHLPGRSLLIKSFDNDNQEALANLFSCPQLGLSSRKGLIICQDSEQVLLCHQYLEGQGLAVINLEQSPVNIDKSRNNIESFLWRQNSIVALARSCPSRMHLYTSLSYSISFKPLSSLELCYLASCCTHPEGLTTPTQPGMLFFSEHSLKKQQPLILSKMALSIEKVTLSPPSPPSF